MEGCVAGHDFYLHEGMCVGKCEGQAQGGACICGCLSCSWAIVSYVWACVRARAGQSMYMWMELGNNLICVGLCEGKSRAEHVYIYVDGAGQ